MTPGEENGECWRRRGRPRRYRNPSGPQQGRCYAPQCNVDEQKEVVYLFPEEIAALDLIDIQQLSQEEAAFRLGISRKTVWRDVHEARHKIADAIVNGKIIQMKECASRVSGTCPKLDETFCLKNNGASCSHISDIPDSEQDE